MIKGLIPLTRIDCKNSKKLARAINSPIIVIPIYDLLTNVAADFNRAFYEIKACGGIHKYLNYSGIIILSLIMRDDLILKSGPKKYAEIINTIKPDAYTTVDGGTYNKEDANSWKEVIRLFKETRELIKLCPNFKPIGHVKGCNPIQIKLHLKYLERLGINTFMFHIGDFFRNGDASMIQQAKYFCSLIKKEDNTLLLYGMGSPKKMLEFSFVDFFITYSHFVNARNGKKFIGTRKEKSNGDSVYNVALHNFKELMKHLKSLSYQTKLFTGGRCRWAEVLQEPQFAIQNQIAKK